VASSQDRLCEISSPLCGIQTLVTGAPVEMPQPDMYRFRAEIEASAISGLFADPTGATTFPKLSHYFENSGVEWPNLFQMVNCEGGPFALSNPVIYSITAIEANPIISFEFFSCEPSPTRATKKGFQLALIKGCDIPELIACENKEDVDSGSVTLTIDNAEIGAEYFLIIDGYESSVCTYEIKSIEGFVKDNVSPINDVTLNNESLSTERVLCSNEIDPLLIIDSDNTNDAVNSVWTIYDENGSQVGRPINKSSQFLKLPDEVLANAGSYTFEALLINPCSEAPEIPFVGSFQVLENVASSVLNLDYCGPSPFDTLGLSFTSSGTQISLINAGTACESSAEVNVRMLNIENPSLIINDCNQIEFIGSIADEGVVNPQFTWMDENGNDLDNADANERIFNLTEDGTYSLEIALTGFNETCVFPIGEIVAEFNPTSFNMTCSPENAESISIQWDAVNRAESYTVNANGMSTEFTAQELSTVISGLPRETTINVEVVANLPGNCKALAQSSCTTLSCDMARSINFSSLMEDAVICLNDPQSIIEFEYELTGDIVTPQIQWFVNDRAFTGNMFDPTIQPVGTYRVRAELFDEGCTATTEETTIEIIGFDNTIGFEIDDRVCVDTEIPIRITGTQYDLSYYQFTAEGGAVLSGLENGNPTLRWQSVGRHLVSLVLESNGCRTIQNITQEVFVENANGVDEIRVNSNSKSALFEWDPVECASSYVIYVNNERMDVTTETSFTYIFEEIETQVEVRVGIESGTCFCPLDSPSSTAFKDNCPKITMTIPDYQTICLDGARSVEPLELEVSIEGIEQEGELVWSGLCLVQGNRFSATCAGEGAHVLTASYTEGGCDFSQTVTIDVSDSPDVSYDVSSNSCPGEESLLTISESANTMVFLNDELILQDTRPLAPGSYELEFSDQNGCSIKDDFDVFEIPNIGVDILGAGTLKQGFSSEYILETNAVDRDISNLRWIYNNTEQCSENCETSFRLTNVERSGDLCVEFILDQECPVSYCIEVLVEPALKVYSPNSLVYNARNSVQNQLFRLQTNSDNSYVEKIVVLNRRGDVMYEEVGLSSKEDYLGWNGLDKTGEIAPIGVYVYYAEVRDELGQLNEIAGDITFFH
jgi:hypothetical protein